MNIQPNDSRILLHRLAGLAFGGLIVLTTGCGVQPFANTTPTTGNGLQGIVHGGENPIVGATVKLYETQSNGYGGAGKLLQTATSTTTSSGSFSFAGGYTCDSGQQAYITASGGSSGSTGTNSQVLMMAAIGPCSTLSSSTTITINEVTTIAAAYALSGFTTISGTTVNVSAPANNNATTGTTSAAAGLAHAFLNAANLASYSSGIANTAIVNNAGQVASLNGIVPAAEINALANALQACVNSTGGVANDGTTNCGTLYGNTPTVTGTFPTNTLQSMINLAQNPYPSATAVTNIYTLASGNSAAFPTALTSAPPDWDIAITYKLLSYPTNCFTSPCTQASYPYHLTLDANDNVYVTNPTSSTAAAGTGINLYGIASNGQLLYVNNTSFPASTSATNTTAINMRNIAADALGNLWVADNSATVFELVASTGNPNTTGGGNATTGAFTSPNSNTIGLAVDASNNVWIGSAIASTGAGNVTEIPYSGSNVWGTPTSFGSAANGPYGVSVDANQNIWLSGEYSAGTTVNVLPNTKAGTSSAPAYTSGSFVSATLNSGTTPYGVAIDASGNDWTPTTAGTQALNKVVPTLTSGVITGLTSSASYNTGADFSSPRYDEVDGGGTVWIAENSNRGLITFNTSTLTFTSDATGGLKPCLVVVVVSPASTTCGAEGSSGAIYGVRTVAIDSTGSVWTPSSTNGNVVQIIGTGSPTWPLLSMGKPATKPQ